MHNFQISIVQYHYVLIRISFGRISVSAQNSDWKQNVLSPNLKTSLPPIWVICHLHPFVRVEQYLMF